MVVVYFFYLAAARAAAGEKRLRWSMLPSGLYAQHLLFQKLRIGAVAPDLQRPALAALSALVELLGLVRRVAFLVPVIAGVDIRSTPDLVIDRLTAEP